MYVLEEKDITFDFCLKNLSVESLEEEEYFLGVTCTLNLRAL